MLNSLHSTKNILNAVNIFIFSPPSNAEALYAMTEHEQILEHAIESLRQEFAQNGQIEISTIRFNDLSYPGEHVISADCSFVASEWEEGIYYDRDRRRYFFYGESPAFSYGGEKCTIPITNDLLSILPLGLLEILQRVAATGRPEVVLFEEIRLLE